MAKKRVRYMEIRLKRGTFTAFFRRFRVKEKQYGGIELAGITALRQLLSNEKARILHVIQEKKPSSIYELTKLLKRDFKSVREDIELLRHFGFVRLVAEKKGKRRRLKPVLNLDSLQLTITI